jgi:ATP-dependent DNA helicase PIF1
MLNLKQLQALDSVKNGYSIFITGPPGVGKSYTLKNIIEYLNENNNIYGVTGLTGIASKLINGQTLHSFLGIGIGKKNVDELYNNLVTKKKKIYNTLLNLEILIIDEISMMDLELFEKISLYLSKIKNNNLPFGNIRLILIGDFCQLPPINGLYCFQSKIWNKLNLKIIQLDKVYRQSDDMLFQKILSKIRIGKISKNIYNELLKLENTKFENITPTKLYCLNNDVDKINKNYFNIQYCKNNNLDLLSEKFTEHMSDNIIICHPTVQLDDNNNTSINTTNSKDLNPIYCYKSYSNSKKNFENNDVKLIINAQIMITRNINIDDGLVNGTIGTIVNLNSNYVLISDKDKKIHKINYYREEDFNTSLFTLFMPITLAYAISIHKCQGSTLDAVEIDASNNNFAPGQLYTALSRAKTLNNIKLINLDKEAFIINKQVQNFYDNITS